MISPATESDIADIQGIVQIVWPVTYGKILSEKQIKYMLHLFYSDESLMQQMQDGHHYFLWKDSVETLGFIDIQKIDAEKSRLHKIYLLPDCRGKGYGKKLMDYAITWAKEKHSTTLLLNVNRHNPAVDFYQRMGFSVLKEEDISIGNDYFMNDFVMQKRL